MSHTPAETRRLSPLKTPSSLPTNAITDISTALTALLADVFTLYVKTKNFHWHMSGPHFRDYHLLLDEQAEQIFAMTDDIAERARKIGGTTLRSIGQIARQQRLLDNDADFVTPEDMLSELREDNAQLVSLLREVHGLCDEHNDVATASLIENWMTRASAAPGSCSKRRARRGNVGNRASRPSRSERPVQLSTARGRSQRGVQPRFMPAAARRMIAAPAICIGCSAWPKASRSTRIAAIG